MTINLQPPKITDLRPRLTVIGVGGAGCNAINNMIDSGLLGVDFVVANTDAQSLAQSQAIHRIQLGIALTEGLGAGSKPEIGEAAAEEAIEDIRNQISGSHMVFVAAGMGGGTGTGAASVIARVAKDLGILTVGVVTKPFLFEGSRRMRIAEAGIEDLKKIVDTLIVIPNQNLFRIASDKTTFAEAFILADQVLYSGVACIVDLILKEGLINLDFADVCTVMSGMGTAMMGTGEASGERRATVAAEEAISNPLLDDVSLKGARGLLLSITGNRQLTLYEVDEAASRIRQEVDPEANIIVGATFDDGLGERVRVSIVASGMKPMAAEQRDKTSFGAPPRRTPPHTQASGPKGLDDDVELQRKLSEAMAFDPGVPQYDRQPRDTQRDRSGLRQTWDAPGNVFIEEGHVARAPFPTQSQRRSTNAGSGPAQAPRTGPGDGYRNDRRMPELDEFPIVGQREFRAKTGPAGAAPPPEPHSRQRKSFLERWTSFGRHRDSADTLDTDQTVPPQRGHATDDDFERRRTPSSTHESPEKSSRTSEKSIDMTRFSGKSRKL